MKPSLQVLEPSLIEQIVDEAMTILETRGIQIEIESSPERLSKLGLPSPGSSGRIMFPRKLVEQALETAPESITLYDQQGNLVAPPQRGEIGSRAYLDPTTFFSGGGGLVSTTTDYMRFSQMLLNGGELDGVRILSPTTVDLMTQNQMPRACHPPNITSVSSYCTSSRFCGQVGGQGPLYVVLRVLD